MGPSPITVFCGVPPLSTIPVGAGASERWDGDTADAASAVFVVLAVFRAVYHICRHRVHRANCKVFYEWVSVCDLLGFTAI